ncbi:hypothetical protein ACOKS3_18055 [Pseudomonas sp. HS6-2]|uniref:hypothetical protein n=1 Tax=Pseudomonas sp. HS6-2 TaxID=3410986 RepID=UPI003BB9DEC8
MSAHSRWSTKSKNFKPEVILNRIIESASLTSDERVSYDSAYFEFKDILLNMIEFMNCDQLAPETRGRVFDFALDKHIKAALSIKKPNKNELINQINSSLKDYLKKPSQEFHLVTSISLEGRLPITQITIGGIKLKLHTSGIPKKYRTRKKFNQQWNRTYEHSPEHYTGVVVSVQARSTTDAFYAALDYLDFIRGVLSFYSNPGMSISLSGRRNGAINRIRLGGMHTLHEPNGSLAIDQYWYEVDEVKERTFTFKEETLNQTSSAIRKIINKICNIRGGERLRDGIIRYTRALDDKDSDYSIIKLWGALESVVNENDNSDILIRRCSYIYKDHDLVKQIMETAKVYRNRNVHAGVSSPSADHISYQIHRIFRSLIFFYVGNKDFKSLNEANSFLDSPILDGDIDRKIYLLKKAVRFRNSS